MWQMIKGKKAQAAVETAIVASIIILAFSALISLTERVNSTQKSIQANFKELLGAAYKSGHASGAGGSYYFKPNITDPYVPGEVVYNKDSGRVLWNGTGDATDTYVVWNKHGSLEKINYIHKLTLKERPGGLLEARHQVRYYDPIHGHVVVRGEYE